MCRLRGGWCELGRNRCGAPTKCLLYFRQTTVRRRRGRLLPRQALSGTEGQGSRGGSASGSTLGAGLTIVGVTLGAKALGLVREAALAAEFGLGPVAEGLAYASFLPSLSAVLLGGVNGAFHSAVVAVAARYPPASRDALLAEVWRRVGPVLGVSTFLVALLSEPILSATGPGLSADVRSLASAQLVAMAPTIWLSGRVGLGFGALSAGGNFWLPAVSSALSSAVTLGAVVTHRCLGPLPVLGAGVLIASATSVGAALQWGLQELVKRREAPPSANLGSSVTESKNETVLENHSDARQRASYVFGVADEKTRAKAASEVMALLLPTAASVGVLQLAVLTDGLFASFEPGTAAAMGYANLLAMAPVGILSSAILLPVLPALSGLSNDPPAFWTAVSDSAVVALSASALLAAWLAGTARPLVEAAFMRAAFDGAAVAATTQLLVAYAAGTPFYLLRDVYARAFFALGDATTPFFVSLAAVALNVVFDWVAFFLLGLGGPGLVFATALINAASALLLAVALRRRRLSTASSVKQPTFTPELRALWRVGIAGSIAAIACHYVCSSLRSSLAPPTTLTALVGIAVGSLVCVAVFALACWATRFHDLRSIWQRYV